MSAKLSPDTTHRKCSRCKTALPLEAFTVARNKPLGRTYECTDCARTYNQAYRQRLKERGGVRLRRDVDELHWPVPAMDLCEQLSCVQLRKWRGPVTTGPLVPTLGTSMPVVGMREAA